MKPSTGAAPSRREFSSMRTSIVSLGAFACLGLAACTGGSHPSSAPPPPRVALTNPTDFRLAAGAVILDVKPFSQTIAAGADQGSAFTKSGTGTYSGNEVLAESTASVADLRVWLNGLKTAPPAGYASVPTSNADVERTLQRYDIAYAAFSKTDSAKSKIGIAVDLIKRYRDLPVSMRQPIDQELKKDVGFSATEATDPSAPLGVTVAALDELQSSDDRAIVELDMTKQ
jgi:hypothetical protein